MSSLETELIEFGLKLFKFLSKEDNNTVFSPISVTTCLSMVLMGTHGITAQELSTVMLGKLVDYEDYKQLAEELKTLSDKCFAEDRNAIISTNLMYSDLRFEVLSQFKQLIVKYFSAKVKQLDFKNNKSGSVYVINSDTRSATNGKIVRLLDNLEDDTMLVLVNALYFKGIWKKRFNKCDTKSDKFTTNGGQQIDVQMMFQKIKIPFGYSQHLKARAVELNYENTNAVLIVLLPDIGSSLKQIRDNLSAKTLNDLIKSLDSGKVDLGLPRFRIESTYDLVPSLNNMGIKALIRGSADFIGLTHQKGLFVLQIVQKAIIEVDEEGRDTVSHKDSKFTAKGKGVPRLPPHQEFKANRPFMYLLVTKTDVQQIGSILFIGECNDPNV